MPRSTVVLIILAVLLLGGCWFLSTSVEEVPIKTIEVEVAPSSNAQ